MDHAKLSRSVLVALLVPNDCLTTRAESGNEGQQRKECDPGAVS